MQIRIGQGFDIHRFAPNHRPLVLGGVTIPHSLGLLGHSDADVLTHAIMDALLGAAGERDIGFHFPNTDPQWKNASSIGMLAHVRKIVTDKGWAIGNVDCSILAEVPKINPYVEAMKAQLCPILEISIDAMGIKATTCEGLGSLGRSEGIAAMSVALLQRN